MHDTFNINFRNLSCITDQEIKFINERVISSLCILDDTILSQEDKLLLLLDKMFSKSVYAFKCDECCYEFSSRTKKRMEYTPESGYIIEVDAIPRLTYSPSIIYRHLMDQWIRREPSPKIDQKHLLQLTTDHSSNDPYAKGFADGFSIGYEEGYHSYY